jgi:hypothetical protein
MRQSPRGCGHQRTQEFQPLCRQLRGEEINAGQVAARPGEARDQTKPDWVFGDHEDDGDRRRRLGRGLRCGTAACGDHGDPPANDLRRQRGQPIELVLGPAVFNCHVLALDITGFFEALAKSPQKIRNRVVRLAAEEHDHRHLLLRARRERPCGCCAAEERDELAAFHNEVSPPTCAMSSLGLEN